MFTLEKITGSVEPLKRTEARDKRLCRYLQQEIEDALAAQADYHQTIITALRQYEGIPKTPYRSTPIENAPNIEITLGAIAVDALYAQAITTIFAVNPILTVNATKDIKELIQSATDIQGFVNWGVDNEWGLRQAAEHSVLDIIQLGTGAFLTQWENTVRKTRLRRIIDRGPKIRPIPIENLVRPGGASYDVQSGAWVAIRQFLSESEVRAHVNMQDDQAERWDLDKRTLKPLLPCGSISEVQMQRETMSRSSSYSSMRKIYEIFAVHVAFDYDKDGEDEELIAFWDRTSNTLPWLGYSTNDYRPINKEVYQVRAHQSNGLGVMEMLRPYEDEITTTHNDRATNVKLANYKLWGVKAGATDEATIASIPNRIIELTNPSEDLVGISMGEVYPSEGIYEATTLNLAERRVGLSDLGIPQASQKIGTRTPATTAATLLQAGSNRFAPAFDNIRRLLTGAVIQCLWRYHEQLLAEPEDGPAARNIINVMGLERATRIIAVLKADDFVQNFQVELTASNASINRDAERQNAILLANFLGAWGEKILQLITVITTPGTPEPVINVAKKLAEGMAAVAERTVRSFDQIRDPSRYIIDVTEEVQQAADQAPQQNALAGIMQLIGGLGGGGSAAPETTGVPA